MNASAELKALGTTARLVVADDGALDAAREVLEREVDALDRVASRFRADSELSVLESLPPAPRRVSRRLAEAVRAALWAARVTNGAVDPTVAGALQAAGYDHDFSHLDDPRLRARPRGHAPVPGWRSISFDPARDLLALPAGVTLDLGATAKALTADRIARRAHGRTGSAVLVSLGGDIATAGGQGWVVGVADHHAGPSLESVRIESGGVATSSTTVRRWERGGASLHHIIDPATGEPAQSPWQTVTVAAASCLAANTASTAAIVLGERAPGWLARQGLPARLASADGQVTLVAGWPQEPS